MSNMSELRQHLHAVEQTRQITNAMYLLSTSRMKKSMQNIDYNLNYLKRLRTTIKDILSKSKHNSISDPFIELHEGGESLFFVITSDKGLCGGFNSNVINLALKEMKKHQNSVVYSLGLIGNNMLINKGIIPDETWYGASQKPSLYLARNIGERIVELYDNEEVNEVYVVYTEYVNSAVQTPVCKRLLPLLRRDFADLEHEDSNITEPIYEPSVQAVFDAMVPQYIIGTIYDVLMQSSACENSSRMTAMQNATKNADKMISELSSQINAERQLAITNEITEIAAASEVSDKM